MNNTKTMDTSKGKTKEGAHCNQKIEQKGNINSGKRESELNVKIKEKEDASDNSVDIDNKAKIEEANGCKKEEIRETIPADNKVETFEKDENVSTQGSDEKKEAKAEILCLEGRSEVFNKIIGIALEYETLEKQYRDLNEKAITQREEIVKSKKKNKELKESLETSKFQAQKCQKNIERLQNENNKLELDNEKLKRNIIKLQDDIKHRDEVIDIIRADKTESSQEFKNAIAAELRMYVQDFNELKESEMNNDVGEAVVETMESVFKVLKKNGIDI